MNRAFCWIKSETGIDSAWRFLLFYIWLWLGIGYILRVYWDIHQQFATMAMMDMSVVEVCVTGVAALYRRMCVWCCMF